MALIVTNTYVNALSRMMRKAFFNTVTKLDEFYPALFNVENEGKQARPFFDEMTLVGFGYLPEKPQGESLTYDDAFEGYVTRYTYVTYAMGYRVSKEMMTEDAMGIIPRLPKALAYAARQTVENKVWNIINLGFDGTNAPGADGAALFSATHPLKGGGTFTNTATAAALSVTALQDAIINAYDLLTDDRGLPIARTAKYLVVPPQLERTALEILKSAYVPYAADNTVNIQYDRLEVLVSRFITDTNSWYVFGPKGELGGDNHAVKVVWRWKDNFEQDRDFDTKSIKASLDFRFTYGWSDWRSTYGNQGA